MASASSSDDDSSTSQSSSSKDSVESATSSGSHSHSSSDSDEEVNADRGIASSNHGVFDEAVVSGAESGDASCAESEVDEVPVPRVLDGFHTTAEHLEQHAYPTHVKDCERCRYWHNRYRWEEDASFAHPRTGLPVVWLVEQPHPRTKPWHLGCLVCMKTRASGPFGRCKAGAKLSNIRRHGQSPGHLAAVQTYIQDFLGEEGVRPDEGSKGLTFAHIMFQRTLLKRGGSFESFQEYCKTARLAGAAIGMGSVGPQISLKLTTCMASREWHVNGQLLKAASCAGVIQDGLGTHLASRLRMVVWKLPRGMKLEAIRGVQSMGCADRGPWLVDRFAGVGELRADHSSEAKRLLVREVVSKNCPDADAFSHAQRILRFFATDAAPDEMQAGVDLFRKDFPKLVFQSTDPSHGCMVALKAALMADEECATVDRLLVSGKHPASLSKLLRTSPRLQSVMKESELEDCEQILSHFGFAPQRFDSRKVPLGRVATRLRQAFTVLAAEAESSGDKDRKAAAQLIIQEMTGESTWRLVLAGMMADLAHEHSKLVHTSDFAACDPIAIEKAEKVFQARLLVLFQEGLIVTKAATDTFTGQVLKFLSTSRLLFFKKKAVVLSLGELRANDDLYMPLNRMRVICQAIHKMLKATRPAFCWGKQFLAFTLPSALLQAEGDQSRKSVVLHCAWKVLEFIWV